MTERLRSPVTAGLIALALLAIGCWFAFGGGVPWGGEHRVHAVFPSALSLRPDSPVRVAGVNVGRVAGIRGGPGTAATVTLEVREEGLPVHRDAVLEIRPRLFLEGNFYVEMKPGSPAAGTLPDGGTIPLPQTRLPVQFHEVMGVARLDTRRSLRTLIDEVGAGLKGGAPAFRRALTHAPGALRGSARAARELRGLHHGDLRGVITSGDRISAALASREQALRALLPRFRTVAQALADRRGELRRTVSGLGGLVDESGPALREIDALLPEVRRFARAATPLLRRLPATLDVLQPVLDEGVRLVAPRELPLLLDRLEPVLRELHALSPRVIALFERVAPVTACVRDNALPVLRARLDDDHLSTGRPVWQELLHAMVGLSSASQDFDGNGPWVRYLAGFGEQVVSAGELPSGTRLFGVGGEPLIGSRPARPRREPPLRPDVPCASQQVPDLRARTAPPAASGAAGGVEPHRPSSDRVQALLDRVREGR